LALLAQGLDAFTAAAAGIFVHAEAGREAARRQGASEGVIATDVIAALPAARSGGGTRHRHCKGHREAPDCDTRRDDPNGGGKLAHT
jgi:hypothetical protein